MVTGSFSLTCPDCGSSNTLTSSSLPQDIVIHCSSCRASLGRWDALLGGSELQNMASRSQPNGAEKPN